MNSLETNKNLECSAYKPLEYLPFISSPAVKESDPYQVDDLLIGARIVSGTALPIIAGAGLFLVCPPAALFAADIFVSILISLTPVFSAIHEIGKARLAADNNAVDNYRDPSISLKDKDALKRIASSPQAFQMVLDQGLSLYAIDATGRPLYKVIIEDSSLTQEVQHMLLEKTDQLFLMHPARKQFFMYLLTERFFENRKLPFLKKILTSENKEIQEFVNSLRANPHEILEEIDSPQKLRMLCQHDFDINARDDQGTTLLMKWIQRESTERMCIEALNLEANPLLTNAEDQTAFQIFCKLHPRQPKSKLYEILLQAETEAGSKVAPASIPEEDNGWLTYFLGKPLVVKNWTVYIGDFDTILSRVNSVALSVIASFCLIAFLTPEVISSSMATFCIKVIVAEQFTSIFWGVIQGVRGWIEANKLAVREYLNHKVPPEIAMNTIANSSRAAELLIKSLSKNSPVFLDRPCSENGETLLGMCGDLEVFRLLVDQGADIHKGTLSSGLQRALQRKTPDFLEYLVDKDLLRPLEDKDFQVKVWRSVNSKKVAEFLKTKGFDPNAVDSEGKTALDKEVFFGKIWNLEHVLLLISVGADPSKILLDIEDSDIQTLLKKTYGETRK